MLLLPPLALVQASPGQYAANTLEGQVLEAETKAPLEGVIVVVNWELVDPTNLPVAQLMVMETVTGKNGRFVFPAWGPKPHPPKSILDPKAPQLQIGGVNQ